MAIQGSIEIWSRSENSHSLHAIPRARAARPVIREEKLEPLFLRRRKITKTSQNFSSTRVGIANVQRIILCSKAAYSQRKAILLVHLMSRCTISLESACKTPRGNNRIRLAIIGPAGSSTAEVNTAHDLSSDRYGRRFLVNAWITLQISS
jgi:hypothetical protein